MPGFRIMVNRSATWAGFDEELRALELQELKISDYDLSLTGFDARELDDILRQENADEEAAPPMPVVPVSQKKERKNEVAGTIFMRGNFFRNATNYASRNGANAAKHGAMVRTSG